MLTTCYLINRMPSFAINDQVPHKSLKVLYIRFHIFTLCICLYRFVRDLSPSRDKFSPYAINCVFLDYSRM